MLTLIYSMIKVFGLDWAFFILLYLYCYDGNVLAITPTTVTVIGLHHNLRKTFDH